MDAAYNKQVKCLYLMGENPLLSNPDATNIEGALRKLEFLVGQDVFLTETAKLAHSERVKVISQRGKIITRANVTDEVLPKLTYKLSFF